MTIGNSTPINALNGLIDLNNNPAFAIDPDGVGGLEDIDGDGFFDDLRIGQNFTIAATYEIDCAMATNLILKMIVIMIFGAILMVKIEYINACGGRTESLFDNFYRSSNSGTTRKFALTRCF